MHDGRVLLSYWQKPRELLVVVGNLSQSIQPDGRTIRLEIPAEDYRLIRVSGTR
ncbi:MAG: hypothetical protein QGF00_21185 [Planctomycetota bacterium]|nr:hypothetical protein [Planctomycetota bacterium]MDP7252137.1 hypothetical protein [Planctomycetota bacterium]